MGGRVNEDPVKVEDSSNEPSDRARDGRGPKLIASTMSSDFEVTQHLCYASQTP